MLDYLLHLNENKNIEIIIYAPDSLVPRVIGNPGLLSNYVKVHISNPGASSDKELVKGLVRFCFHQLRNISKPPRIISKCISNSYFCFISFEPLRLSLRLPQ